MDKKFIIQGIALLIVIFLGLFSIFRPDLLGIQSMIPGGGTLTPTNNTNTNSDMQTVQILFIDQNSTGNPELVKSVITADVANTPEKRALGLSDRQTMGADNGMIFLFEKEDIYNFIMRRMQFPLDFIWVRNDQIVDLLKNIQPDPPGTTDADLKRYAPVAPINKVIEVNAGYIDKHGLKVGDRIKTEVVSSF